MKPDLDRESQISQVEVVFTRLPARHSLSVNTPTSEMPLPVREQAMRLALPSEIWCEDARDDDRTNPDCEAKAELSPQDDTTDVELEAPTVSVESFGEASATAPLAATARPWEARATVPFAAAPFAPLGGSPPPTPFAETIPALGPSSAQLRPFAMRFVPRFEPPQPHAVPPLAPPFPAQAPRAHVDARASALPAVSATAPSAPPRAGSLRTFVAVFGLLATSFGVAAAVFFYFA